MNNEFFYKNALQSWSSQIKKTNKNRNTRYEYTYCLCLTLSFQGGILKSLGAFALKFVYTIKSEKSWLNIDT